MYIKRLGKYGIKIKKNMEENYQARFQELVIAGTIMDKLLERENLIMAHDNEKFYKIGFCDGITTILENIKNSK